MATMIKLYQRAGEGGDDEQDEFLDAGRADPTANGIARIMSTKEFLASTVNMQCVVPKMAEACEAMQSWDLDYETCRLTQNRLLTFLQVLDI